MTSTKRVHGEDESPSKRQKTNGTTGDEKQKATFIGALDAGTTSFRFIVFNTKGCPIAKHQMEFGQKYPKSGWHEQSPKVLVDVMRECIDKAVQKFVDLGHSPHEIVTVGITNQRETTLVWDWETGEPLHDAIAWPDTRTTTLVRELKQRKGADDLQQRCGLPLTTYPSSVKLLWLLRHVDAVKQAYEDRRLAFGTVDTWLIYNLTRNTGEESEGVFITDPTNASRTMFMNLHTLQYDDESFEFFQLDRSKLRLPKIVPSSDRNEYGIISSGLLKGVPITACLGDQSAALVGQQGFTPGSAKNTYGTGCFLLYNVGEKPVISKHGLLATVAYDFGKGFKPVYALEGSIAVAGSGVKFLINNLNFAKDDAEINSMASEVKDNGDCYFVTAFSGLFAPYWIDDAKGTMFGITAHTHRGHIARATLEATCFQTQAILDAMEKDSGSKLTTLAVDGGMSNSDLCMQTQADIVGIPIDRPQMCETTALGAAIAAGFAMNVWQSLDELKEINREGRTVFEAQISREKAQGMIKRWSRAVEMCRGWGEVDDDVGKETKSDHSNDLEGTDDNRR